MNGLWILRESSPPELIAVVVKSVQFSCLESDEWSQPDTMELPPETPVVLHLEHAREELLELILGLPTTPEPDPVSLSTLNRTPSSTPLGKTCRELPSS